MYCLAKICYCCLKSVTELTNISELDVDDVTYKDKLSYCLFQTDHLPDEIPKNLCNKCCKGVKYIYNFRKTYIRKQLFLRSLIMKLKETNTVFQNVYSDISINVLNMDKFLMNISDDQINLKESPVYLNNNDDEVFKISDDETIDNNDNQQLINNDVLFDIEVKTVNFTVNQLFRPKYEEIETDFVNLPNHIYEEDMYNETDLPNEDIFTHLNEENKVKSEIIEEHTVDNNNEGNEDTNFYHDDKIDNARNEDKQNEEEEQNNENNSNEDSENEDTQSEDSQIEDSEDDDETLAQIKAKYHRRKTRALQKRKSRNVIKISSNNINGIKLTFHRNRTANKKTTCRFCRMTFSNHQNMKYHCKVVHRAKPGFACDFCEEKFSSLDEVKEHELIHSKGPFRCKICNKLISQKANLKRHIKNHAEHLNHRCTVCGKCLSSKQRLITHKNSHYNDLKIIHNYASTSSEDKDDKVETKETITPKSEKIKLETKHIKTNKPENKSENKNTIPVHNLKRGPGRPRKNLDQKPINKNINLKDGLLRLPNQKRRPGRPRKNTETKFNISPISCDICKHKFANMHILQRHVERWHATFECDNCKRNFKNKYLLKFHKKSCLIKYNIDLLNCAFCNKRFEDNNNLTEHLKSHENDILVI